VKRGEGEYHKPFAKETTLSLRNFLEAQEEAQLAPYAIRSTQSTGRAYPEEKHEARTEFQRDRDRVIYSNAFRRLEYKTQVFPNHEGDHYRTRLTHTIEVANLTRTMARNLRINEDFAECLAMVHDIGHPPFGHVGETILNELMSEHGGFEHNEQTLRIVTELEHSYTAYPGLNLTNEICEAILQHTKKYRQLYPDAKEALLETQLVSITDEMAYDAHDLEDGLASGILQDEDVRGLSIMNDISSSPDFPGTGDPMLRRRYMVRQVLNTFVLDCLEHSMQAIKDANLKSIDDISNFPTPLIGFSDGVQKKKDELELFLKEKMYRHPKVMKMMNKSSYFMERMFKHFCRFPLELPNDFQSRMNSDGLERSVADYLAGMTDRFLQEEYIRLFMPFQKIL
jgi:dGTPase